MTAEQKRVESNRVAAKYNGLGNVICHALIETFGYEGHKEQFESCLKSRRFGLLLSMASHVSQFDTLIKASAKIAVNPNTKARLW